MTVINPNSISGITSITLPSGDSNVLTVHTNDGVERFRIDSSGNVKVGSACTISQDGDVFFTGVTTATTFTGAHSGSGANLTALPAANLTGTLPAISATNLTNVPAANITGTLPAISAASLTSIPAANIVGVCTAGFSKTGGFGGFDPSNHMVLEELCSPCDGSVITLQDGNHTLTQPSKYDVTDTFTDIVGSSFTYTPPSGTSQVIYDFRVFVSNDGGTDEPILSFALYLDSNEVIRFRRVFRAENSEQELSLKWSFNIGGSADTNVGRVASWTSDKTIKLQVDRYSSNYPGVLHETNHWGNGGSTDMLALPTLHVKAIGTQAS